MSVEIWVLAVVGAAIVLGAAIEICKRSDIRIFHGRL